MSGPNSDDEETPFGLAKKYQRGIRASLALGWIFLILGAGIVCLLLIRHFSFYIFGSLLFLIAVCVCISISHFFDAGYASAQKQYEPKLLTKENKYRDLEKKHNDFVVFHHERVFKIVMICFAQVAAIIGNKPTVPDPEFVQEEEEGN